ncbi:hotdog fold domain-containing protein [Janibacter sp. GXQ6167]|uniref:hotdog fold domain-containing protein n=1 Tax=Janibacter sp. GXQ6167 TaxID=3240791 RepID=UPI0035247E4C
MAPKTYDLYQRTIGLPFGKKIFSVMYAQFAPYFWTVRPQVREMRPNYAELSIKKRRAVHNHIGTLHAIAVLNGLEAVMGLVAEASCPPDKRWIPRGLSVKYLAKSTTDLLCVAETDPSDWEGVGDIDVRVKAIRTDGVVVVEGVIPIYVSAKPTKGA